MLAWRKDGVSVYALREMKSSHAQKVINEICVEQGKTFDKDPYFIESFHNEDVGIKAEHTIRAQINAGGSGSDPNSFILYLRHDGKEGGDSQPNEKLRSFDTSESPILCSAVVNTDRNDKGNLKAFFWSRLLLFLYCLPYFFRWGPKEFFGTLSKIYSGIFDCGLMGDMAAHLGVKMHECYQLEYLATHEDHIGKGYGKALMKVFTEIADAEKKIILLYSSTKKNVPFYKRLGMETYVEYGKNCTYLFRRPV